MEADLERMRKVLGMGRPDRVEGQTVPFDDHFYARPYQDIQIGNYFVKGLRDVTERHKLFLKIFKELKINLGGKGSSYLDIGCNQGYFVNAFGKIFETCVGIDCDKYYIEIAEELYPHSTFKHINIDGCIISKHLGHFQLITALSMIEYVKNTENFVGNVYNACDVAIFEGHSMDIATKKDKYYENVLAQFDWMIFRRKELTDAGLNAPDQTGRPVWVCVKK